MDVQVCVLLFERVVVARVKCLNIWESLLTPPLAACNYPAQLPWTNAQCTAYNRNPITYTNIAYHDEGEPARALPEALLPYRHCTRLLGVQQTYLISGISEVDDIRDLDSTSVIP